ncbi:aspartate/glutamate racemase family protein [Stigmatella hybrida]|uniref:aspartate/glutamate racemase family protein n=1 Tax=Stigmatella hybrida TaxID=394097 RepID=UPI001CDB0899|nr:amino acid racemase [Stigmatella hybrida]
MDNAGGQHVLKDSWNAPVAPQALLGIVGGMGPLASAEFLKTLYEENRFEVEQEAPACLLLSDPNVPDRTDAIVRGEEEPVTRWLEFSLRRMQNLGARRVVIACITMHHFLNRVSAPLRDLTVSLVDLALDEVIASGERWLLLTSRGTRNAGIFERSERWRQAAPYLVWPSEQDQDELHGAIYRLKKHGEVTQAAELCARLVHEGGYGVNGFIAGCTEFHLVTKHLQLKPAPERLRSIDPLFLVANRMSTLVSR